MTRTLSPLRTLAVLLAAAATLAGCDAGSALAPDTAPALAQSSGGGFTVLTLDAASGAVRETKREKASLCHRDATTGTYKLISVGAPAYAAHVRHGDGVPGGDVPTRAGFAFDEGCGEVPKAPAQYTCTTEAGVYAGPDPALAGRATLTVTLVVLDPALLPISGGDASGSYVDLTLRSVNEGGQQVGIEVTGVNLDPAFVSTIWLRTSFPASTSFTCGPYTFGGPAT